MRRTTVRVGKRIAGLWVSTDARNLIPSPKVSSYIIVALVVLFVVIIVAASAGLSPQVIEHTSKVSK